MKQDMAEKLERDLHRKLPLVRELNCHIEEARPGYVKASMAKSEIVTNHFGSFHAGALYTFAETVGGGVATVSLDCENNVLMAKQGLIKYMKTVNEIAYSEAYMADEEIQRITAEVNEKGKSEFEYTVTILNQDREPACEVTYVFYLRKKKS